MKIKILEYQILRGNKVKVQSHNKINGKWIENPKYAWHKKVVNGDTSTTITIINKKEYKREVK